MPWQVGGEVGHPSYRYRIYGGYSSAVLGRREEQFNLWAFFHRLSMCSVLSAVQYKSCAELICVTNVHTVMSADKCKLSNVCLWGHVVAQLVEAPSYKLEDSRFDSQWYDWNFLLTYSFQPHCGPGFNLAFNSNEYQE